MNKFTKKVGIFFGNPIVLALAGLILLNKFGLSPVALVTFIILYILFKVLRRISRGYF